MWVCQMASYSKNEVKAWNCYKSNLSIDYLRFDATRLTQKFCDCECTCTCNTSNDACNLTKTDADREGWNYVDYIILKNLAKYKDLTDYYKDDNQFLVKKARILLNGQDRVDEYQYQVYSYLQNYSYFKNSMNNNVFFYNFGLDPTKTEPSGSMNFSKVDQASLDLNLDTKISYYNPAKLRVYALNYNILKIEDGIGSLVFSA